jgi:transcriptional regulator EpsA
MIPGPDPPSTNRHPVFLDCGELFNPFTMSQTHIAPEQSECLLRVMEAAPQVCRRHQFFVWTQGDFQRWLPHKISICGAYDRDRRDLSFDVFNSVPVPDHLLQVFRDAHSMFLQQMLSVWQRGRQQAAMARLADIARLDPALTQELSALGYDQVVMHGLTRPGRPEELESFFVFVQQGVGLGAEALQALDMLLPSVHQVYERVCVTERLMASGRQLSTPTVGTPYQRSIPITEREREILMWVRDGLSNQQIGEKLGISALTVKNHVQKILRKMSASNRAQAVAKAMMLNILGNTPHFAP